MYESHKSYQDVSHVRSQSYVYKGDLKPLQSSRNPGPRKRLHFSTEKLMIENINIYIINLKLLRCYKVTASKKYTFTEELGI